MSAKVDFPEADGPDTVTRILLISSFYGGYRHFTRPRRKINKDAILLRSYRLAVRFAVMPVVVPNEGLAYEAHQAYGLA